MRSEGEEYMRYGFSNLFSYNKDTVWIFKELDRARYVRGHIALHGSTVDYIPVPDLRVRIVGTEIDYPLPEED